MSNSFKPQPQMKDTEAVRPPKKVVQAYLKEILSIAEKELSKKSKDLTVLDIGSGVGEYTLELSRVVKKVVGVEPYLVAHESALKWKKKLCIDNALFYNYLIEDFDTKDRFDLAISLTNIEHMPDADASFKQVFKLLKPGGIIYATAPNKLWPFEGHYRLLFLSYLPLTLANLYLLITGRGDSYQDSSYSRTYFGMKKLFNQFPCQYYFFLPSADAIYLGMGTGGRIFSFMRKSGIWLIKHFPLFWVISKGYIMIIKKN